MYDIIFLDFDGVLNSAQEVEYHRRLRENIWWRKLRFKLWNFLYKIIPNKWIYRDGIVSTLMEKLSDHQEFCPIACSNIQLILEQVRKIVQ